MKYLIDVSDKRNQYVLSMLKQAGKNAFVYLEYINRVEQGDVLVFSPAKKFSLEEVINFCPNITVYCGNISQEIKQIFTNKNISVINFLQDEEFAIKNAQLTAEGVLALILEHTDKSIIGQKILFLGGGRITKASAILLEKIGAKIYIATYNEQDYLLANYYSIQRYYKDEFLEKLGRFDCIVNTRPIEFFTQEMVDKISKSTLFIETASKKCIGENLKYGFKYLPAPALPQKYASYSAGKIIADKILIGERND